MSVTHVTQKGHAFSVTCVFSHFLTSVSMLIKFIGILCKAGGLMNMPQANLEVNYIIKNYYIKS